MFDFRHLDDIDADNATPEWLKWRGVPECRMVHVDDEPAVLEEVREEQMAAVVAQDEEWIFEKLEIPFLPEEDPFDPMGLAGETSDAIEEKTASLNGQVIVNFVAAAVEELLLAKQEREQHKAYIEYLHQQRLAFVRGSGRNRQELARKEVGASMADKFDRKQFSWREVQTPFLGGVAGLPDGSVVSENALQPSSRILKSLTKVRGAAILPTSALLQLTCAVANIARPMPANMRRMAEWHLTLTDVFFPSGFILDDGRDYTEGRRQPPTLVHLVAMSINKEQGALPATHLLENIKLARPSDFPSIKTRPAINPDLPD